MLNAHFANIIYVYTLRQCNTQANSKTWERLKMSKSHSRSSSQHECSLPRVLLCCLMQEEGADSDIDVYMSLLNYAWHVVSRYILQDVHSYGWDAWWNVIDSRSSPANYDTNCIISVSRDWHIARFWLNIVRGKSCRWFGGNVPAGCRNTAPGRGF